MCESSGVILYTCGQEKSLASVGHACGRAAKALDDAGYEYELCPLPGYRYLPWTWGARREGRREVSELTDQLNVPVLVLDEGQPVVGSGSIVKWAKSHPHSLPEVGGG